MMKIPFYRGEVAEEDRLLLNEVLESGWLTMGPKVQAFEEKFASWKGTRHALALSSCTAGLFLMLKAAGIGPGDEVITTPLTFAATANTIVHVGATPIFADVEMDSQNLDPKSVEERITERTRAIVVVHFGGRPCAMNSFQDLAKKYNLFLFEDCAHTVEAVYHDRPIGTLGDASAFSFYANKNLSTGEGGMLLTNRDDWAERVQILRLHGMSKDAWQRFSDSNKTYYQVVDAGYKMNMTDLQAALALKQMDRLSINLRKREELWNRYSEGLSGLPIELPLTPEEGTVHSRHIYTIRVKPKSSVNRDELRSKLAEKGVSTSIHYTALNLQPYYQIHHGYHAGQFPNAEVISSTTLTLPLFPSMKPEEQEYILKSIGTCF